MLYFKIAAIVITVLGLLIYTIIFDRKYFFPLLVVAVISTGILSFYIFYYIGSYNSSENDALLETNIKKTGIDLYDLNIDVKWNKKPEIFGFDGKDDIVVVRYSPEIVKVLSVDKEYENTEKGKSILSLSKDYKYYGITKKESEIAFYVKDGMDDSGKITLQALKRGGYINVFYLHDYKIPLESEVYWEKNQLVELGAP